MTTMEKNLYQIVYFSAALPELTEEALLKSFVRTTGVDRFGAA